MLTDEQIEQVSKQLQEKMHPKKIVLNHIVYFADRYGKVLYEG